MSKKTKTSKSRVVLEAPRTSRAISRRDALRLAATAGAASSWPASLWLAGCNPTLPSAADAATQAGAAALAGATSVGGTGSSPLLTGGAGSQSPTTLTDAGVTSPAQDAAIDASEVAAAEELGPIPNDTTDPKTSWWLQHEYAPVAAESDSVQLEVIGSIPPELDGIYVRNGSNPKVGDPGHWFLGNGMAHGVRLQAGKALWYKNRYVQTPLLQEPAGTVVKLDKPASNVSFIYHASHLLALGEVGFPYEISKDDLSTLGKYDFNGKLKESFTAHPKIDPMTGEMLAFAYTFAPPFMRYYQIDAQGAMTRSLDITQPNRRDGLPSKQTMMHDFQITQTKVVFLHLPITLDVAVGLAGKGFPYFWDESNGTHIGIMPRDGGSDDVIWIEIDPCFIFHTLNAHDDENGNVVLDAMRVPGSLWAGDNTGMLPPPAGSHLVRYTIDLKARTAKLEKLSDRSADFPRADGRTTSRAYRYGYMVSLDPQMPYEGHAKAILKYDRTTGAMAEHAFAPGLRPDEAAFVPASKTAGEDEGYLMTYVYDRRTDKSSLFILDASNISAPPIAQIKLPYRVPCGFHGGWIPS